MAKEKFTFELGEAASTGKGIPMAAELNAYAAQLAKETLLGIMQKQDKTETALANKLKDGIYEDVIALADQTVPADKLEMPRLEELSDAELKRLLESRRSDRSKTKKLGLGSSATILHRYVSAGFAEIIIRKALKLEYKPSNTAEYSVDELAQDQEALNKKIRSLQSKVSNLRKEGRFAPADWPGLKTIEETQQQIAELQARRLSATTSSSRTIKAASLEQIRQGLAGMSVEEAQQLLADAIAMAQA